MIRAPSFEVESNCLLLSHPPMVRTTQGPDSTAIAKDERTYSVDATDYGLSFNSQPSRHVFYFIPPVTNGLVCICVYLLRVRGSFFDQSCDFLRLGNINSVTPSASKVWQRLEIRRQFFCLSLTTRDTLFPLVFPAPRRAFYHQRMDLLDPDKPQPEINVSLLMVEPGSGRRRVFRIGPAPRIDHEGAVSFQQRAVLVAVIGKEHVPLTGQINQLLELVRVGEVPHRHAEHNAVRLLEAYCQLLDFVPDGGLGLVHRLFVHTFVLRPDGLLVEVRQLFLPNVQGIDHDPRTSLTVGFEEGAGDGDRRRPGSARRGFDVE